jgi:hypothetical protein
MASTTTSNVFVEVIRMESAVSTVADVGVDLSEVPRCGRFSTGIEVVPAAPTKLRVGRFSDGVARAAGGSAGARIGRFSTGTERWPDAPDRLRVGSFADGYA